LRKFDLTESEVGGGRKKKDEREKEKFSSCLYSEAKVKVKSKSNEGRDDSEKSTVEEKHNANTLSLTWN
jgi:hypothetical protein